MIFQSARQVQTQILAGLRPIPLLIPSARAAREHARKIHASRPRRSKERAGKTSPNPAVGAVLVKGNRIIARGYHRQAGGDNAEVDCLRKLAGPAPPGAILYVTLEPCSTRGRTAPCANYIIERSVRSIVIGTIDPNPQHRGRAVELLRAGGVDVTLAPWNRSARDLMKASTNGLSPANHL